MRKTIFPLLLAVFVGITLPLPRTVSASSPRLPLTQLTYTGPTVLAQGQPIALSAVLKANGTRPLSGRAVVLSVGSQSCTATTNVSGTAMCVIPSVSAALGKTTVTASFAGDTLSSSAKDTKPAVIFTFLSSGSFVLGDRTVASALPTTLLTWWGAQWQKLNSLSGGSVPAAFKGFATTLSTTSPSCGATWTSSPGKSARPPASAPSYMAVIVASTVTKSRNTISGNSASIVIVKTNPGYANNPGGAGIGTMVALWCHSPHVPSISGSGPPRKEDVREA